MKVKIECIYHRPGGTYVSIGKTMYHFAPGDDGRHVAEVENPEHVKAFLDVPEAYRLAQEVKPDVIPASAIPTVEKAEEDEQVSDDEQASDTEAVEEVAAPTLAPQEEQHVHGPDCTDPYAHSGGPDGDPNTLDREELARAYEEKFGRRPHGKWNAERILAELKV